jgi:hypothetical protein
MKLTLHELAQRRETLVAQSTAQRATLAASIEPWRQPLALADHGLAAVRVIARHPVWIAAGIGLFAAIKPARIGLWLGRGLVAWRLLRSLRGG